MFKVRTPIYAVCIYLKEPVYAKSNHRNPMRSVQGFYSSIPEKRLWAINQTLSRPNYRTRLPFTVKIHLQQGKSP